MIKKPLSKIILIGMKYAGKTTLGKTLAQKLQLPFIDLDRVIEADYATLRGCHKTCRQIWKNEGEESFRRLEEAAVAKICTTRSPTSFLLATGGGTILSKKNRKLFHCSDYLVLYLQVSEEQLLSNFLLAEKNSSRQSLPPFLASAQDPSSLLQKHHQQRHPLYTSVADLVIKNEKSLQESVEKIASQITLWKNKNDRIDSA